MKKIKSVKFCKDCKWFEKFKTICQHPKNLKTDFVKGGVETTYAPQYLREADHWCSSDGNWFEVKELCKES